MARLKIIRPLKLALLLFYSGFLLASMAIVGIGLNDSPANADIIVVPGTTVMADGTLSPRLQARLEAALGLFQHQRSPLIFVSGGTGREGVDEALAMAGYLKRKGVPAQAIIIDSAGVDTAATARNAAKFMHARHLSTALIATQYFHVARTRLAMEQNGVQVAGAVHARYVGWRDLYSVPREVIAYAAYLMR